MGGGSLLFSASPGSAQAPDKVLTAAVPKFFPEEYDTSSSGQPKGFAIDAMREIARLAGYDEVRFLAFDEWPEVQDAVRSGRANVIPLLGMTEERIEEFAFTVPYHTLHIGIFVREGDQTVRGVDDLAGKVVGVVRSNVAGAILAQHPGRIETRTYDHFVDVLYDLFAGQLDAIAYPNGAARRIADKMGVGHKIVQAIESIGEVKRGLAVRKGDEQRLARLDAAVRTFVADPAYRAAHGKWHRDTRFERAIHRYMLIFAGILAAVVATLVAWRMASVYRLSRRIVEDEERYRSMFTQHAAIQLVIDPASGKIVEANEGASAFYGYPRERMARMSAWELSLRSREQIESFFRSIVVGKVQRIESQHRLASGVTRDMEVWCSAFTANKKNLLHCILHDVTARHEVERALKRANRGLNALAASNHAIMMTRDRNTLLFEVCNSLVQGAGYDMVWIGEIEQDSGRAVKPMMSCGDTMGYLNEIRVTWADEPLGRGPTGTAARTGQPQTIMDMEAAPTFAPWRDAARRSGFRSSVAFPLFDAGRVTHVLTIYSREPGTFDADELKFLGTLAGDLSYALRVLDSLTKYEDSEKGRIEALARLSEALTRTVTALALTIEKRDPYTAGHQQRVAGLAVAIAHRLNLSDQRVEGIRLGALLHDIGKISIPAEILVKPGRFSPEEFELVKGHCQSGYEIIKDIPFDWPIGRIALEHHERLDGGGYPRGLKGDQICLEARIISVADVAEAITSHRPYRPALGLEAAIVEIEKGRGVAFDADVVDACLSILRGAEFKF
ncbi:MAG: HD domain-containing phosphohydrolase [Pseudomonadota bacterium]